MPSNVPTEPNEQQGETLPIVLGAAQSPALAALQPPVEDEAPLDLRRYRAALYRYKWLILLGAVAGLGIGLALTKVQKPKYLAQATIWIQQGVKTGGPQSGPIQEGQLLESFAWQDLVRSYVVLDEVVREMHLFLTPKVPADSSALAALQLTERFRPGDYRVSVDPSGQGFVLTAGAAEIQRGAVGDSVGERSASVGRRVRASCDPDAASRSPFRRRVTPPSSSARTSRPRPRCRAISCA